MDAAVGVLGSLIEAATPAPPPLLASDAEVKARLTATLATQKQVLRDLMAQEVVPLLLRLQDPAQYNFAKILSLQQDPAGVAWAAPVVNTLEGSTPERMDHKLGRFHQFSMRHASRIVSDYRNDPGHSWGFPADQAEATLQYLELIALKAVYLRTMAALDAAKIASVSLADALALYRKEGDLVVPLPQSHIDNRLPPFERAFDFHFTPALKVHIAPTMQSGLWSFPRSTFISLFGAAALAAAADLRWQRFVKFVAFLNWHIVVVGFDYLSQEVFAGAADPGEIATRYVAFREMIREQNAIAVAPGEQEAKVVAQLENLTLSEHGGRLVVAPIDPVLLVADILGNALLFTKLAGGPTVDGPYVSVPASLMYLAHHTSDTRDYADPRQDKFSWIVASAAVALAKRPAAPAYCPAAYAKVRALGLPAKLPDIPLGGKDASAEHADVATKIEDGLTAAEKDELAQFILRAEKAAWGAFTTHRANIASYARIRAYYGVAAAP